MSEPQTPQRREAVPEEGRDIDIGLVTKHDSTGGSLYNRFRAQAAVDIKSARRSVIVTSLLSDACVQQDRMNMYPTHHPVYLFFPTIKYRTYIPAGSQWEVYDIHAIVYVCPHNLAARQMLASMFMFRQCM